MDVYTFPTFLQNYCFFYISTTILLTPFLRSPLNNTVAKTFSSLLFQLPHHFSFNLETLETIDLTFPYSSHHTISLIHEPLHFKLKLPNLHSRDLPETLFQLSPQFLYPNILFSRLPILCTSYISLLTLILKKKKKTHSQRSLLYLTILFKYY